MKFGLAQLACSFVGGTDLGKCIGVGRIYSYHAIGIVLKL